jgi:hypothetical protein
MNERIKELALQAEQHALSVCENNGHFHSIYREKFAELIVKECASMARVFNSHEYDFTGDLELDEFMLKHFGVEE